MQPRPALRFTPAVLVFAALACHSDSPLLHYLWQYPGSLGADFALRWARDILAPLFLVSAVLFAAWLLGRRILSFMSVPEGGFLDDIEAIALGAGAWALTMVLLGLCNGFRAWPISIASAALIIFSDPRSSWAALRCRGRTPAAWSLFYALLSGIMLFALWHGLISALAPPTDSDVLMYHLPMPQRYLSQGNLKVVPWLFYSHWPHLMNVFYALALMLRQEAVAGLLNLAAYVLTAIAVFRVGREWCDAPTAWLACALLVVQPIFANFAGMARIDGWLCLFIFLACVSVWRWELTGRAAWLVRGGLLGGLAASTKLLGAGPLIVLAAWVMLRKKGAGELGRRARAAGVLLLCGAAPCLVWYLKSWIESGNPVWPLAWKIFGGKWGAEAVALPYMMFNIWPSPLTVDALLRNQPQYIAIPLAIALIGAWLGREKSGLPPFLRFGFWIFLPYALVIARSYEAWRYCVPWLAFMALAAGWGLTKMARANRACRALAGLALCFGLYPVTKLSQNNELFAVLSLRSLNSPGRSAREVYLARTLEVYPFVRRVNELLAPGRARGCLVLMFPATIGYYWDVDYQWGDLFFQGILPYWSLEDGEALGRRMRDIGVTYVFVNQNWLTSYDQQTLGLMRDFLSRHGRPLLQEDGMSLWAVDYAALPPEAGGTVLPGS